MKHPIFQLERQKLDQWLSYSAILICLLAVLVSCGDSKPAEKPETPAAAKPEEKKVDDDGLPIPTDEALIVGKNIFVANCMDCHVGSFEAPDVTRKKPWAKRVAKGASTLHKHAIEGFHEMPAKGDNPKLTDDEVKTAVNFILYVHENV